MIKRVQAPGLQGAPIEGVEDKLRETILESTEKMITELTAAIGKNPARALSVIETVSSNQRRLLAMLGDPSPRKKRRQPTEDEDGVDAEFMSLPSLGGIETFGAQLFKELLPLLAKRWGLDDKPTFNSLAVNALIGGIREAKEMGDGDLEQKLRDKLDQILEGGVKDTADGVLPPRRVRAEDYLEPPPPVVLEPPSAEEIMEDFIYEQQLKDGTLEEDILQDRMANTDVGVPNVD